MDYLPVLAGIFAALCWGGSDYLAGTVSKKIGQYRTTAYVTLFSTLTLLPVLLYTGISPHIGMPVLLLAVLSSVGGFLGFFFAFRAFTYGDLSITAPIFGAYPMVTVIGAVLILGDRLSNPRLFSIITVIFGVVLISTKLSALRRRHKLIAAGVGSAIIAMMSFGLIGVFAGAYVAVVGYVLLSIMWRGTSSALSFAAGRLMKQDLRLLQKKFLLIMIVAGVADALGILVFLYAVSVQSASLPIVATLSGLAGAVPVVLAVMLLKERPEANQWLGILLAIAGVVALSYFS